MAPHTTYFQVQNGRIFDLAEGSPPFHASHKDGRDFCSDCFVVSAWTAPEHEHAGRSACPICAEHNRQKFGWLQA